MYGDGAAGLTRTPLIMVGTCDGQGYVVTLTDGLCVGQLKGRQLCFCNDMVKRCGTAK